MAYRRLLASLLLLALVLAGCASDDGGGEMVQIDPPSLVVDGGGGGGGGGGGAVAANVFVPPGGTEAPHGLFLLSGTAPFRFHDLEGEGPLVGLGGDGIAVVFDLSTREVLYEREAPGHSFWGVAGWDMRDEGGGAGELLAFGTAGPGARAFGGTSISPLQASGNHLDVVPFGSALGSRGAVVVTRDTLTLTRPATGDGDGRIVVERKAGVGPWVSAYARSADRPILAVTSLPSALYVVDPAEKTMEKVADLGEDLRRLRCSMPVCIASDWGGSALHVLTWDGTGTPVVTERVPDVEGPVGIDLRLVAGGVEVVSTGYEDDSIHFTRVAYDGSVRSSERRDAPVGCEGPGHALWVGDEVLVSCTDSGKLALVER